MADESSGAVPTKGKKRAAAEDGSGAAPKAKKAAQATSAGAPSAGASSSAAAPAKAAPVVPTVTGNPMTDIVYDYLKRQNRPYSSLQIEDNLHKTIKRGAIDLAIVELAEKGLVVRKEYGKNVIAWVSQDQYDASPEQIAELTNTAQEARARAAELAAKRKALEAAVKALETAPKLADVQMELAELRAKKADFSERLAKAKGSSGAGVPTADQRNAALGTLERYRKAWSDRRAIVMDTIDAVTEGAEDKKFTPKNVAGLMGISGDEEAGVSLKSISTMELAKALGVDQKTLLYKPPPPKPKAGKAGAGASGSFRPASAMGAGAGARPGMAKK